MASIRVYGHIKDREADHKLFSFVRDHPKAMTLPLRVNLIEKFKDIFTGTQAPYDQGTLGSCTSQGLAFAFVYDELSSKNKAAFMPARLFIYYNERSMEGTVDQDSGAQICDGVNVLKQYGVCEELLLPYDCAKFTEKPPDECYSQGLKSQLLNAQKLDIRPGKLATFNYDMEQIKSALATGHPIVFGFNVFESFESEKVASTGIMPIPADDEQLMGGHCVAMVGYDDSKQAVLVRNSWGPNWGCSATDDGCRGYFWMPYQFLTGSNPQTGANCTDFWVLGTIEDPAATDIDKYSANSINPVIEVSAPIDSSGGVVNPFA